MSPEHGAVKGVRIVRSVCVPVRIHVCAHVSVCAKVCICVCMHSFAVLSGERGVDPVRILGRRPRQVDYGQECGMGKDRPAQPPRSMSLGPLPARSLHVCRRPHCPELMHRPVLDDDIGEVRRFAEKKL